MFQFPGFALIPLWIQRISPSFRTRKTENRMRIIHPHSALCLPYSGSGFPHSEIPGSKPVRGSPRLIAAYHVLHRLSAPRHPPNALKTLDRSHRQRAPFGPLLFRSCERTKNVPIRLGSLRVPAPEDRTKDWRWTFRKDQFCFKRIREP